MTRGGGASSTALSGSLVSVGRRDDLAGCTTSLIAASGAAVINDALRTALPPLLSLLILSCVVFDQKEIKQYC